MLTKCAIGALIGLVAFQVGLYSAPYRGAFDLDRLRDALRVPPPSPVAPVSDGLPRAERFAQVFGQYPVQFVHPNDVKQLLSELFPDSKFVADVRNRRVYYQVVASDEGTIRGAISSIDHEPNQIQIEVQIIETSDEFSESLKRWLANLNTPIQWSIDLTQYAVMPDTAISGFLESLKNSGRASLLAQPSITALDNQTAIVRVGEKIPFLTTVVSDRTTSLQVNNAETGISLEVTPQVSTQNFVQVDFKICVDNIKRYRELSGNQYPVVTHRLAQSRVGIPSGQTLVIAGLIDNEQKSSRTSVPGLDGVPIVGELFSTTTKEMVTNNVVVFITPKIMKPATRK